LHAIITTIISGVAIVIYPIAKAVIISGNTPA
jgi:hypothetical protein